MKKCLIPIVAITALLGACSSKPQMVDARAGRHFVFNTSVGRELVVRLDSNPSTGYDWRQDYDASMLSLAGTKFEPSHAPGQASGRGGMLTLRFKALRAGETKMTLIYSRGWEYESAEQKMLTVSID